jgi:hypothetical protein
MSFTLRQIEEKHTTGGLHDLCHRHGEPCDVVKLARALDAAVRHLREQPFPTSDALVSLVGESERVLEEVAGE